MKTKGFTLIELLAVIVILGIILAIAVPSVLGIIEKTQVDAFKKEVRLVVKAIKVKMTSDDSFDPNIIDETNIKSLLEIDDKNYRQVSVSMDNGKLSFVIVGQNEWDNLTVTGTKDDLVVNKGLILWFDANNLDSYPGNGSTWYDLSGNDINGTVNGAVTWVENNENSYFNFPNNSDADYIATAISQEYKDLFIIFKPDYTQVINTGIAMLISRGSDKSLRFVASTTPWHITSRNPGDVNDWAYPNATNYYINGVDATVFPDSGWVSISGYRTNYDNFPLSFPLRISGGYPGRNFVGKIALVAMYNRKLSEQDALKLFNLYKNRFGL